MKSMKRILSVLALVAFLSTGALAGDIACGVKGDIACGVIGDIACGLIGDIACGLH